MYKKLRARFYRSIKCHALFTPSKSIFRDWSAYYGHADHDSLQKETPQHSLVVNDGSSYYVYLCRFIEQNDNGAIKFSNNKETTNLLIESTLFDNCSSKSVGGSLHFKDGECMQVKVCYHNSSSNTQAHAYSSVVTKGKRNYAKMSSFCSCGNFDQNYAHHYCIDPDNGIVQLDSVNMSNNIASYRPTFDIDSGELNSYFQFTEFINNTELRAIDVRFAFYSGADLKVSNCNFLKNHGITDPIKRFFFSGSNTTVNNCCFKENNCQLLFESSKTILVLNCYYDNSTVSGTVQFFFPKSDSDSISLPQIYPDQCFEENNINNKFKNFYTCDENSEFQNLIQVLSRSIDIPIMFQFFQT